MGFGEATLVHFDSTRRRREIAAAGAMLRDPDLGALRRVIESLARQAQPIADLLDPKDAAARGMEHVLQLAEAQVAQAASAIRSLDASVLVSPLTDGINTITEPLRDFTSLVEQLVTEVRAVLEQVRAIVAALPIDDLAIAIRNALAPVTEALQFLQHLVDEIREALELAANDRARGAWRGGRHRRQFKQEIDDALRGGAHVHRRPPSGSDRLDDHRQGERVRRPAPTGPDEAVLRHRGVGDRHRRGHRLAGAARISCPIR